MLLILQPFNSRLFDRENAEDAIVTQTKVENTSEQVIEVENDTFTFLVGGKAGEGVKRAGLVASQLFGSLGRFVFQMDDYQSLIRGGHNFSVISSACRPSKS